MSEDVLVASNRLIQENDLLHLRGVLGRPWELFVSAEQKKPSPRSITSAELPILIDRMMEILRRLGPNSTSLRL